MNSTTRTPPAHPLFRSRVSRTLCVVALLSAPLVAQTATSAGQKAATDDEAHVLPAFTVDSSKDTGYIGSNSLSATRAAIPVVDMPVSIMVLTRDLIDDTAPLAIMDIARNVSGVSEGSQPGAETFQGLIRGFGPTVSSDGWVNSTEGSADLADVERVEILKGPSAILFVQGGSAGGTINVVTKNPLDRQQGHFRYQFGLYDSNRAELDVTGPVPGTDGKLLYRFITSYQDDDGYGENVYLWRRLFAPSLTYRFSEDSQVTLKYSHYDDKRTAYTGQPIDTSDRSVLRFYDVPRDRTTHDPEDYAGTFRDRLDLTITTKLSDYVRATVGGQAAQAIRIRQSSRPNGNPLVQPDGTVLRQWFRNRGLSRDYRVYNDYVSAFRAGPTHHNLVVGWEATHQGGNSNPSINGLTIAPTNLYSPTVRVPLPEFSNDPTTRPSSERTNAKAYAMDSIKLWKDRIVLAGGVTRSWYKTADYQVATGTFRHTVKGVKDTKQYGIVLRPIESVSLYYGYNQNFNPQTGTLGIEHPDGTVTEGPSAPPQQSISNEFGVKLRLLGGRLSWNVAHFDIDLTNRRETILGTGWSRLIGGGSSKGWETDMFYQVTSNWSLLASYADMEVLDSRGNPVQYATTQTANLWTRYNFDQGALKGFGIAGGFNHTGDRPIHFGANRYRVDGRTLVNAALYYGWKRYKVQVNVSNLFDENYVAGAWLPARIYFGDGRNITATVTYSF